jgi:predicted transcriptional regulator of viral defense system
MNYTEFQNTFKSQFLIQKKDIIGAFPRFDQKNLTYWQKKGYLKKIINNFYTFSNISFDRDRIYGVSNCLCDPSYVSSFQALDYYGFIPEQVAAITAVTTHITRKHTTFL